jgi:hypothetical protein
MTDITLYPIVANGHTYNESDLAGLGYIINLPSIVQDVIAQIGRGYFSTSSTSTTIPAIGGIVNMNVAAGLQYQPGDQASITSQAAPQTNYMQGFVIAYNAATGAIQVQINNLSGAGTLSAWWVNLAGFDNTNVTLNAATYGIVTSTLGFDQGSIGAPQTMSASSDVFYTQQRGSMYLGLETPMSSMIEIFEDFQGAGNTWNSGTTPFAQLYYSNWAQEIGLPWCDQNPVNNPISSFQGSEYQLFPPGNNSGFTANGVGASVLTYGNNGGWLHLGKGALVMEWIIRSLGWNGGATKNVGFCRFGLAACGAANPVQNIFGNGGIGFMVNEDNTIDAIAGIAGQIIRISTGTTFPYIGSIQDCRFRVEVDHTGTNANFYINDVLYVAMTSANGALNAGGVNNLLIPAVEVNVSGPTTTGTYNNFWVSTFYLAKYLSR